jgi:hypothetical protein
VALGFVMQRQAAKTYRFPIAGSVEHEARDTSCSEIGNASEILYLLGYIETVEEQHDGSLSGASGDGIGMHDNARQARSFIGHFDVLDPGPADQPRSGTERIHAAAVSRLTAIVLRLHEALAHVIVVRGSEKIARCGNPVAFRCALAANRLQTFRFRGPFLEPCPVVSDAILQTEPYAIDFVDLAAAPLDASQRQ